MAPGLNGIDWSRPWLVDWAPAGRRIDERMRNGMAVWDAINQEPDLPVRAVPAAALPAGEGYESFIDRSATCPTREGRHDLLNALCWLHLPLAKRRMNRLHVESLRNTGASPVRGGVRDAITLLDENGALLCAPEPLWDALRAREWKRLFVDLRPLWPQARVTLVGHALAEKLEQPRKAITAHVWAVPAPAGGPAACDAWLARQLDATSLAAKPFVPLPVLGIPGWWLGNEAAGFYDDAVVFRPARSPLNSAACSPTARGVDSCQPMESQ